MGPLQLPDVLAGHELRPAAAAAAGQPIAGALLSVQGRGHRQTHQLEATAQESRKGVRQPEGHVRRRQFGGFAGAIAKAVEGGQQRRRRRCGAHADDIRRVSDRLRDARDRGREQGSVPTVLSLISICVTVLKFNATAEDLKKCNILSQFSF